MDNEILNLFDDLAFPVLITDHRDILIYKNGVGRKTFTVPRRGSSIKSSIAPYDINIIDDGEHTSEIHTLRNTDTVYRRALVLKYGNGSSAVKIWIFDITLQMLKPEMARTFLYNAANLIYPLISEIIEKKADAESVFGDGWTAPLHKLSIMLNNALRKLYFINAHEYCSAEEFCKTLNSEVLNRLNALGIFCKAHRISLVNDPTYIDYYNYTMLFMRVFLMIINRNIGNIIDVSFIRDVGLLRTEISFAAKLTKPKDRSGNIRTLRYVFENDSLNIALIDSLIQSEERARLSYDVRTWDMKNVTIAFDFPTKSLPGRRLRQYISLSDIDFTEFTDLIVSLIRNM